MPATGKICNFDCIYCENGFNADRRTSDAFATLPTLREALEAKLVEMSSTGELPDVITLAGNGEPTASPAPDRVKSMTPSTAAAPRLQSATAWSATRARSTSTREKPIPPNSTGVLYLQS